eukprot:m.221424 g.221424  ORF g.221424 m.221424 type:complete len:454 (+) comp31944_c0_seq1:51-1412(+)
MAGHGAVATPEASRVIVLSACSLDYLPGHLCAPVNRVWAERHGYAFRFEALPAADMERAVSPRNHLTWYKVLQINTALREADNRWEWVVWIDADAIVVHPERTVDSFARQADLSVDLILGEDVSPSCKVNAGVMLIRNTAFTRRMWTDIWACHRWHTKPFHEQSALCRWLRINDPGFGRAEPWYSWDGADDTGHRTDKTWVLPHLAINTNVGSAVHQKHKRSHKISTRLWEDSTADGPAFVFHAIGCSPKLKALRDMLSRRGMPAPLSEADMALLNPRIQGNGTAMGLDALKTYANTIASDLPQHVSFIALDRNHFQTEAAVPICTVLTAAIPLRCLDLSFNALGDDGMAAIATAVASAKNIEVLQLERVGLTLVGASHILQAMKSHGSLRVVDVSGNGLQNDAQAMTSLGDTVFEARGARDVIQRSIRVDRLYPTTEQAGSLPDERLMAVMW